MRSNYDKWEDRCGRDRAGRPDEYVAPARGSAAKWRNRRGRTVEVLVAADEGLDTDGLPWAAICTDHGAIIGAFTKADAIASCRDTSQFCEDCRAAEEESRRRVGVPSSKESGQ